MGPTDGTPDDPRSTGHPVLGGVVHGSPSAGSGARLAQCHRRGDPGHPDGLQSFPGRGRGNVQGHHERHPQHRARPDRLPRRYVHGVGRGVQSAVRQRGAGRDSLHRLSAPPRSGDGRGAVLCRDRQLGGRERLASRPPARPRPDRPQPLPAQSSADDLSPGRRPRRGLLRLDLGGRALRCPQRHELYRDRSYVGGGGQRYRHFLDFGSGPVVLARGHLCCGR